MKASVVAIEYSLPEKVLTNAELAATFGDWSAEKIFEKTGISERRIAAEDELSSDLAVRACQKLFESAACEPDEVDFILLCTQSPDYFLPTTACLVHERLGLRNTCGALDFNLGCSGFVYGLGLAKGLIESGQASKVLLVTAETYSKFINPKDRSVRTLFGDAAAATLIQAVPDTSDEPIGSFIYGTDGRGACNLLVPAGGMRKPITAEQETTVDSFGNERTESNLYMNGAEIFAFTLRAVPAAIDQLLQKTGTSLDDIDLVVFHQANEYMLRHLQKKMKISDDKFVMSFKNVGNTVSSTIPIALADSAAIGRLKDGDRVLVVGFGVGYSWAATILRWRLGILKN